MNDEQGNIILYQSDSTLQLEVRMEDETVWLTQSQMMELFQTTRNNITIHISNIFKEKELDQDSVCKESLLTASDGKKYRNKLYNLDVIISVGYRVKSLRGTQFRIWANRILKDYLLKGYAINIRVDKIEKQIATCSDKIAEHDKKIDFFIRTSLPPIEGVFYDGQIFDAYKFAADLIKSAKKSLVLVDNYIDESVLMLLTKRSQLVVATIYTAQISKQLEIDLIKHNSQYNAINIKLYQKTHDRFLIIDETEVYHIGASIKDLGKKLFAFSKMQLSADELLSLFF